MEVIKSILSVMSLLFAFAGCNSSYGRDRGADAKDIFTIALPVEGSALLVSAGIGPMCLGVGYNSTCYYGLAADRFGKHCIDEKQVIIPVGERRQESFLYDYRVKWRKKQAAISLADIEGSSSWTQFNLFAILFVGVNPGEFIDFLAELVGIDMYNVYKYSIIK